MSEKSEIVVLGGGLTGLSFSYHFDRKIPVYERESCVGGLIRTISKGPYKFDLAPHLLHFRSPEIKSLVLEDLGLKTQDHARKAMIYFGNKLMPYPFELNLYETSDRVRNDCLRGLNEISTDIRLDEEAMRSGSFADYSLQAFGPGISHHYLLPYNRKIWDTDPAEMTCEWMRFLPTADLEKIRQNAEQPNNDSFGYNTRFYYPTEGGIQDLADAFAAKLENVHLSHAATHIDVERKLVRFQNGHETRYEHLVSTLPLKALAFMTGDPQLMDSAKKLVNTTVFVVNVVVEGRVPDGVHWAYFPEPDLTFYRISFPKNYFDRSAPDGQHILSVEVGNRDPHQDQQRMTQKVIEQLREMPIFDIQKVVDVHVETIPHAYCIYDQQRTPLVARLTEQLLEQNIHTTGRFGKWEYSAMEDAIVYGQQLAAQFQTEILPAS